MSVRSELIGTIGTLGSESPGSAAPDVAVAAAADVAVAAVAGVWDAVAAAASASTEIVPLILVPL